MVAGGAKYFKGKGGKRAFRGAKYTNYNKINNNSENFRGKYCCQGGKRPPLVAGLISGTQI